MTERAGDLSIAKAQELCRPSASQYPPAGSDWPKMFYHGEIAPLGQTFKSEEEFLGQEAVGWSERPIAQRRNHHAKEIQAQEKGQEDEVKSEQCRGNPAPAAQCAADAVQKEECL